MNEKNAKLYRMASKEHTCPFGIKALDLLKRKGYQVDDNHLETRKETDSFKEKHNVKTTPQVFMDDKRIGGFDDLQEFFGITPQKDKTGTTYKPIIAVFSVTFLMALSLSFLMHNQIEIIYTIESFIALSMCVLAIMKLQDLFSFTNQFIGYDLLGKRSVRYAYFYPFAEAFAGVAMLGKVLPIAASTVTFFIGSIGAVSVIKAVYIDKRELKCACVGGNSNVPLGFISLTENLAMIAIAIWTLA